MRTITVERRVDAPPERVWDVLVDLDRAAERLDGITAVERLDDGDGFGVGTAWRETRVMFGREATEEMVVTDIDQGRSYTVEANARGATYRSVMQVEPAPEGCVLRMQFGAKPKGTFGRVMAATLGRLFEPATRRALRTDLDDIAGAAEQQTS